MIFPTFPFGLVTRVLTEDIVNLTDGRLLIECDAVKTTEIIQGT